MFNISTRAGSLWDTRFNRSIHGAKPQDARRWPDNQGQPHKIKNLISLVTRHLQLRKNKVIILWLTGLEFNLHSLSCPPRPGRIPFAPLNPEENTLAGPTQPLFVGEKARLCSTTMPSGFYDVEMPFLCHILHLWRQGLKPPGRLKKFCGR